MSPFERLAENCPLLVCGTKNVSGIFNFLNGEVAEAHYNVDCRRCDGACVCYREMVVGTRCGLSKRLNRSVVRVMQCSKAMFDLRSDAFLVGGAMLRTTPNWRSAAWCEVVLFIWHGHGGNHDLARGTLTFTPRVTSEDVSLAIQKYIKARYRGQKCTNCTCSNPTLDKDFKVDLQQSLLRLQGQAPPPGHYFADIKLNIIRRT